MVVEITKLDNYGRGICYVDDKITFVLNALPGEKLEIEITKFTKKYNEAIVKKYISKSSRRIEPICEYYDKCGGCNLMHMSYEDELEFKEQKIKDIMYKYAHIENEKVKKIIPNNNLNYRNKVTFKVKNKIGYYKEKSTEIIPINKCYIIDEKINKILDELNEIDLSNIYEIVIRTGIDEDMIVFKGTNIDITNLSTKNIILFDKDYKVLRGNNYIIDKIGDFKFYISPNSFFQVNKYNVVNLYNKVLEYVKESSNLLDLYCGTGSIGIYLSGVCKKITGVEINKSSIEYSNRNKELNHLENINFVCLDTDEYNIKENFDTIVVDPPRSGLGTKTINYLNESNCKKIVYVSCDPLTLARDLKILSENYNVIELTPVDMFSRTYHCETVCVLERK